MRGKLVLTFLAGLAVGLAVAVVAGQRATAARQAEAAALAAQRQEKPPQWEYKVVTLSAHDTDATNQVNQLARERWEFVGRVSNTSGSGNPVSNNTSNLFRRPGAFEATRPTDFPREGSVGQSHLSAGGPPTRYRG